jgi:hypothetical protein
MALSGLTRDSLLVESDATFLLQGALKALDTAKASSNGVADIFVEMSPNVYLTLCALVKDNMEIESDATPLLKRAALELSGATAGGMIPSDLLEEPRHADALRRGGFMAG